jgi:hypothetical protein
VSNHQKAELVSDNFSIQSFQGCHGEGSPRDQLWPKGPVSPELPISANWPYSDSCNSEITDHLESNNEPSESGESCLTDWYSVVREFQFRLGLNFGFFPAAVCPEQISTVSSLFKIP